MTEQDPQAPTCPRHPGQVAFVTCQRCGRPTCHACQRPAAVGIQCVDCVNEARASTPAARGVFGAALTNGRPVITIGIIALCTVIWIGQKIHPQLTYDLAYVPYLSADEPWRYLTAAFVHSPDTPFHLLFNMYALWICGQYLEPLLGRVRFIALYLICAFGSSVGYELLASVPSSPTDSGHMGWLTSTVGASGAVFGLFAAVVVLNRHLGRSSGPMIGVIVLNAVLGFVVSGIAWQAHLGGLVTGAACSYAITASRRKPAVMWGAFAGIVAVLLVAAVVRYESVQLPLG